MEPIEFMSHALQVNTVCLQLHKQTHTCTLTQCNICLQALEVLRENCNIKTVALFFFFLSSLQTPCLLVVLKFSHACLLLEWPFQSYTYKMRFLPFRNVSSECYPITWKTLQHCKDFQVPIETHYASFFFSHSTSYIEPRFQFVVWPFLCCIHWQVQIVLRSHNCNSEGKVHLSSSN